MRIVGIIILALGFTAPAIAQTLPSTHGHETDQFAGFIQMYGAGNVSCATYQSSKLDTLVGNHWSLGFWSGLNAFSLGNKTVGVKTDQPGIRGEIGKQCRDKPSEKLSDAVVAVYIKFLEDNR